jgi:hypothetical protein
MLGEPPSGARQLLERSAALRLSDEWECSRHLPFQWQGEDAADDEWAGPLRGGEPRSDYVEWVLNKTHLRRLSLENLRAMRAWDKTRFVAGMENDERRELEAHGFALEGGDPAFWPRLRKLGATPEMLAQANAILFPSQNDIERERLEREAARKIASIEDEVVEATLAGRVALGRMAALPSVEDRAKALRQPEDKRELADACWHHKFLEQRLAACKASKVVERRWMNGRLCPSPDEDAAGRLLAARDRVWRAAVAVASHRRPTCTEGPCRRTRARSRGAGRPGRRRVARAHASPGGEASEGEPAKRPALADDDVDLAAALP